MPYFLRYILLFFALSAISVVTHAQIKVDESNLITRLAGLYTHTPAEVETYFITRGFTVKDVTKKRLMKKYTSRDSSGNYLVSAVNNCIFSINYITHADRDHQNALKVIKNMGFVNMHPEKADSLYVLYGKPPGNDRVNILISHRNDITSYIIGFSNMLTVEKLMKME